MRLNWLRPLTTDPGPFATVLLDATSDEPSGAEQVRLRWRNLRDELARAGADDTTLQALDRAVEDGAAPDGTAGRVLVAGSGGLLLDRFVEIPPSGSGTAVWSALPDLGLVLDAVPEEIPTVVARIEDAGGEVRAPGETEAERVTGDASGPVHKVSSGDPGESGAQNRVDETLRANAKAVADRVEKLTSASGAQLVVVTGDGPARSRLREELTTHTLDLVTEIEHSGAQFPDDLPATLLQAADDVRESRRGQSLSRYAAAIGRSDGFAVTGLTDVLAAVRAQAVEILVLDRAAAPDRELWVSARAEPSELAVDRDELAAMGTEAGEQVPAVSALVRAVSAADGELVLTGPDDGAAGAEGVTLTDGLGAVLRFPIGPAA